MRIDEIQDFGRILHVNLTTGRCSFTEFPEAGKPYFGGRGFNTWYLYHQLPRGSDPLSPENIFILSCGFLTGSSAPGSSRLHINALSPLTGILGSSNIGGYAGAWLRSCNIASVIVTGSAATPSYLFISQERARLLDAGFLWGQDTYETREMLNVRYGDKKIQSLLIGPAGETRVRFAAIISGKDHAAGRTGMGAVLGSKNLKAIVVAKGNHKHFTPVTATQKNAIKNYTAHIRTSDEFRTFSTYGGSGYLKWANDFGIMGSKNYSEIGTENIEQIDGKVLKGDIHRSSGCFRCPVQCKADLKFKDAETGRMLTRPEFEPMVNLGPKCGLNNLKEIIGLDNLCNRLGVDSTSAATTIAFVMDLHEKGLLPIRFSNDLDLSWGNARTMETLLRQMVSAKGLGKVLRKGVREASKVFGNQTTSYAAHVKGLEMTAYHPATIMGTALGYAVSSRGGDYNNIYASLEYSMTREEALEEFGTQDAVDIKKLSAKGYLIRKAVIVNALVDSLGLCKVPVLSLLKSFNLEFEIQLINSLCGLEIIQKDFFDIGMHITTTEKKFNIKHSKKTVEDKLPQMFFNGKAGSPLSLPSFNSMLREYYKAMEWDRDGIPPA